MTQKVFTVYDSKGDVYMNPFLAVNALAAIRTISDLVQQPDHMFSRHSQDFTLFELGEYDDSNGRYQMLDSIKPVMGLWELKSEMNLKGLMPDTPVRPIVREEQN